VVRAIADRVIVMHRGRICQMGTTAEVYHPPHHPYTEALLSAANDIHLDGSDMPDRAASFSFVNSLKREL
jgi:ABC-type oligopeptide transport system ATPase subunit